MVIKKKKRHLRGGAVENTDSTQGNEIVAEVDEAQVEETDKQPDSTGIGGRQNRIRAKKTIKKKVKPTTPEKNSAFDGWDLLELDIRIVNKKQFMFKVLNDISEESVNRFWMKDKKGQILVATAVQKGTEETKIEIEPTEIGQELAEALWEEIEGEGNDPTTIDVSSLGWHFHYGSVAVGDEDEEDEEEGDEEDE